MHGYVVMFFERTNKIILNMVNAEFAHLLEPESLIVMSWKHFQCRFRYISYRLPT